MVTDFITIIMYHGVVRRPLKLYDSCFMYEDSFRSQIRYLKKKFEIISLSQINERIRSKEKSRQLAVITFDDGYQNNYDIAFPILYEEGVHSTIFLTTGLVGTNATIWPYQLHNAFSKTSITSLEWNGSIFNITSQADKLKTLIMIKKELKKKPLQYIAPAVKDIIIRLDEDPNDVIDINSPYRMLSPEAIKIMAGSGLVEFGAHTHSHAILSRLTFFEQEYEIRRSIEAVRDLTGFTCNLFAYPNGTVTDYNSDTIKILQSCGITIAVTTIGGYNNKITPLLELRRYGVDAGISLMKFKLTMNYIKPFWQRLASSFFL